MKRKTFKSQLTGEKKINACLAEIETRGHRQFWGGLLSKMHIRFLLVRMLWCESSISVFSFLNILLRGASESGPIFSVFGAFCSQETKDNFSDI